MTTMILTTIPRMYKNAGQHAEQTFRFAMTGEICRADHVPAWVSGDVGDIQVKSSRATICHGTDISAHLAMDAARRYAYVNADFTTAYIMTKDEYKTFASLFCTVTRESTKNGGAVKLRFKAENRAMREWLATA